MKNQKLNAVLVCKQIEDDLGPRLRLTLIERAVYSHLFRRTHLEGKSEISFSINSLARGARICRNAARKTIRSLAAKGVLHMIERTYIGHVVKVLLPEEVRAGKPEASVPACLARRPRVTDPVTNPATNIEEMDFLLVKSRRQAIHAREGGRCFYCLSELTDGTRCLDHVVPLARMGSNSYRNLVSCCMECNTQKRETAAEDFLRGLFRQRRLGPAELAGRLRALDALAAGKLRPLQHSEPFGHDTRSTCTAVP